MKINDVVMDDSYNVYMIKYILHSNFVVQCLRTGDISIRSKIGLKENDNPDIIMKL